MRSVRRGARSVIRRQKAAGAGATGTSCPVRPAFEVHPAIQPVPDSELRRDPRDSLNLICDISDWRLGPMVDLLSELGEPVRIHRKAWELGKSLHGMQRLGVIRPDSRGVSVGAGAESCLFYLANHVHEIVATDLYQTEAGSWGWGSDFLANPERYAPFPYRHEGLSVRNMSGLDLEFETGTFDFAYTLSSIEHFGGHEVARQAVREMARVTKPGGIVCVVTELQLSQGPSGPDVFSVGDLREFIIDGNGLQLIEPHIDLRISESLLAYPVIHLEESDSISPHIVLYGWGGIPVAWTSVILFLRK